MKFRKLKRYMAVILAMLLAAAVMAACGGNAGSAPAADAPSTGTDAPGGLSPVGELPISTTPLEMTMSTPSSPSIIDWATNDFTLYMEEKTGIKWNFTHVPVDAFQERINLLMNSGDYPEAFLFYGPDIARYGIEEQMLLPLEDLIPQYMPNYWAFMQENPAYWEQQVQSDGHIYGIANINVCYHCKYFNKMWANMNYIDEIGLGVPETTEEFAEVCRRFLELYPNGVAVTGSTNGWGEQFINFLSGSFITNPGFRYAGGDTNGGDRLLISPEGEVVTQANQPQFREFLTWMNELYEMGAIYDGGFTQLSDQFSTLLNQPDAPVLFAASGAIVNSVSPDENPDLYRAFRAIAPLAGPDGTRIATEFKYDSIQENAFVLTDKCQSPEAALRWADTFFTLEGRLGAQFGYEEGVDYVLNPEGEVGVNGEPATFEILSPYSSDPQNHDWQDFNLIFAPEEIRFGQATPADVDIGTSAGLEKFMLIETQEKCEPYAQDPTKDFDILPTVVKLTADETNAVSTIAVELGNYIDSNMISFINGTLDITSDDAWNAYLEGFANVGLDTYLEVYQAAMDRMKAV